MKLLKRIKARIRKWHSDRFLRKHHCRSYKEYNHRYDPDRNIHAVKVEDYYHGYPYVYLFTNSAHKIYDIYDYGMFTSYPVAHDIINWCTKNCKHKFRHDCLSLTAYDAPFITENPLYVVGHLGLGYMPIYYAFAFKDKLEYTMFVLKWS